MKRGFTLVELIVVVSMIVIIMGAMTTSVSAARHRARVQKATSDVKVISQAILAYENYANGNALPTMTRAKADAENLKFLLGDGDGPKSGGRLPVLLEAALSSGDEILDPWGHPYLVTIRSKGVTIKTSTATGSMNTGFYLPNFYRRGDE